MQKRKGSSKSHGPRHLFIPDTQVKPGVPTEHLEWAAKYAAQKRPDVIVQAGDWYDMPSLSSYERGKLSSEGRRYQEDIEAGNRALERFDKTLKRYSPRGWNPRKVVTLGNHDGGRIERAVDEDPRLAGKLSLNDLAFERLGWEVHSFLDPVKIHGVTYIHYCPLNAMGKVTNSKNGAPSALAQGRRMMATTVCGHKQGLDVATIETPAVRVRSVIAGSFYRHSEPYLTHMGNNHWHGILVLNDIQKGDFDLCEVSMNYLERRFG